MAGLSSFFAPSSVAVVGASEDLTKVASIIYDKLQRGVNEGYLKSEIFPINPHHSKVGGRPCYPNVTSLPKAPELLVIAVPVASTLRLVDEAARKGVKAIVIIAGGFGEAGRAGLEQDIAKAAKKEGIRILGPNTIGLLDTSSGMDTLFLPETKKLPDGREIASLLPPLKGGVVIVTQSGHLGEVVAEELRANFVGVRAIVGVGNQLDVSVEDVLEHFSDDKETKVIAVYLEGVKQGLRFLQKATHAAMKKPIIVFKTGKTEAGAKAAVTHTASMVGDYRVYQAAFRQSGLVEVQSLEELVDDCTAFAMQPEARGNRVAILTNAGGTGVMSADESARVGLHVGPLEKRLGGLLGKEFAASSFAGIISMSNPLDLTATAKTDEFIRAFDLLASSEDYDMILAFPTHQPATMDYAVVDRMTSIARDAKKPVVVGVMGRSELAEIFRTGFQSQGIPAYATPERCVRALRALAERRRLLKSLANPKCAAKKGLPWLDRHRGLLSPRLNERLLRAYGIPCAKSVLLRTRKDVNSVGQKLRFPLAVKLVSGGLAHKSDVGGVILNVKKDTDAASAYLKLRAVAKSLGVPFEGVLAQEMVERGIELILGSTRDPTFGPVLAFGIGGTYTEILQDFSVAVGAIDEGKAMELIQELRMGRVLDGHRGGPKVDRVRIAKAMSAFSSVLEENPSIDEIEINPLIATEERLVAVDVRTVVA